jgi:hypothetical protein
MKIDFWNVKTLYQAGKFHQLTAKLKNYKLDTLGLSEVRWNQFGELKTPSTMTFLYSGRLQEEAERRGGVGVII